MKYNIRRGSIAPKIAIAYHSNKFVPSWTIFATLHECQQGELTSYDRY